MPILRVAILVASISTNWLPTLAAAQVLRCDIASKHRCDANGGCQKVPAGVWNIVNFPKQTLARCDAKGCETYPAQFVTSGAFINIALPANGMLAKMASDGSTFLETATLMGTVLVSFGACREQ